MGHKYRGRQVIDTPAEAREIGQLTQYIDPIDTPPPNRPDQPDLFDDL